MIEALQNIIEQYYDLPEGKLVRMAGYANENYRWKTADENFVVKIYRANEENQTLVEAENFILEHLFEHYPGPFPRVIQNRTGSGLTKINEGRQIIRVLNFLPGKMMAESPRGGALYQSIGNILGKLSRVLQSINKAAFQCRRIPWDLDFFLDNELLQDFIDDPSQKKIVRYFYLQYKENVWPVLSTLPKSLIHNDANDWNILVHEGRVSGLIDFGDMVYSSRINELAIACTYACMGEADPIGVCTVLVGAFHREQPLNEVELNVLYYLIAARLCTSVCQSADKRAKGLAEDYFFVSEKQAWDLLDKWIRISPLALSKSLCKEIGFVAKDQPRKGWILKKRRSLLSPTMSISYRDPIHMDRAAFQYMYDRDGNTFLDAYNNIMLVGHCHPHVVEAGQRMIARLNTNTRYLYDVLYEYADKLLSHFPSSLNRLFLVNSGSAASDLAIRLARTFTNSQEIVAMEYGYHGNTAIGIDVSHYKFAHQGGGRSAANIHIAELPDNYRGKYNNLERPGTAYAADLIDYLAKNHVKPAAFIAEPIVGCGGQVPLAAGYLKEVYPAIRRLGGLCISDEVQVGFGRLGDAFWGFETHGVIPDIVILGKPMGNGHPIGGVVTTEEIAQRFDNGMEFFSSFGGNPVSCAIGLAVLEVLETESLPKHAHDVGQYWIAKLESLSSKYEWIGDVRGQGLFLGVDWVESRITRKPNNRLAQHVKEEFRRQFILTGTDGPSDHVMKVKPPLCFDKDNVDIFIDNMDLILSKY